jgi:hypothetical protein
MHDNLDSNMIDEAAVTARFARIVDPTDGDVTARIVVRKPDRGLARRRLIRSTRQDIARLRDAIAAGWDVGPELAHEERRLAALEKMEKAA